MKIVTMSGRMQLATTSGIVHAGINLTNGGYGIYLQEAGSCRQVATELISQIDAEIEEITLGDLTFLKDFKPRFLRSARLLRSSDKSRPRYRVDLVCGVQMSEWTASVRIEIYLDALMKRISNVPDLRVALATNDLFGFTVILHPTDTRSIKDVLQPWVYVLADIERSVDATLLIGMPPLGTLLESFEFPVEVRVPCEQYLMHFAEFLRYAWSRC